MSSHKSRSERSYVSAKTLIHKNLVKVQQGYTLIELLIGISIIGIIFSVGFANFRDFARRQAIAGASREIAGELRLAQERALSGQKPSHVNCNDPNRLSGFSFLVEDSTSYSIQAVCSAGTVDIKNVTLSPGIEISTPSPNPIVFKVLGEGTNIPDSSPASLDVIHTQSGDKASILITSSGEIKQ